MPRAISLIWSTSAWLCNSDLERVQLRQRAHGRLAQTGSGAFNIDMIDSYCIVRHFRVYGTIWTQEVVLKSELDLISNGKINANSAYLTSYSEWLRNPYVSALRRAWKQQRFVHYLVQHAAILYLPSSNRFVETRCGFFFVLFLFL